MAAPYNLAWIRLRHSEALAANLALTGRRVFGEELQRMGIATEVVADDEVLSRARALAEELASFPPSSIQNIKSLGRCYSTEVSADEWFDKATSITGVAKAPKPQRNP